MTNNSYGNTAGDSVSSASVTIIVAITWLIGVVGCLLVGKRPIKRLPDLSPCYLCLMYVGIRHYTTAVIVKITFSNALMIIIL